MATSDEERVASSPRSSMYWVARDRKPIRRRTAFLMIAFSCAALAFGISWYAMKAPHVDNLVAVELDEARPDDLGALQNSLLPDVVLIAAYGTALGLLTWLAVLMAWTKMSRNLAKTGRLCVGVTVVADLAEDAFLWASRHHDWAYSAAGGAAALKWSAAVPAALTAFVGLTLTSARLVNNRPAKLRSLIEHFDADECVVPAPLEPPPKDNIPREHAPGPVRWRNAFKVPPSHNAATDVDHPATALCLSGGGIRSASVALGGIQALRPVIADADFIISVSGGGFVSGALVQAMTRAGSDPNDTDTDRDPRHLLAEGSALEDHIRRNSSYLASTASKLLTALVLFGRGLLASLFVLYSGAVVGGVLIGVYYNYVPISGLSKIRGASTAGSTPDTYIRFGPLHTPALWTLAGLVTASVLAWVLAVSIANFQSWESATCRRARQVSAEAAVVAAAFAVFVLLVPTLTYVCCWFYVHGAHGRPFTVGGPVVMVLLSYFATIKSVLWNNRKRIKLAKTKPSASAAPASMLQLLLIALVLVLIALTWLLIFGVAASTQSKMPALTTAAIVLAGWLILGGLVDETAVSLHPFYRSRLAKAFAVRVKHGVAEAYARAERTRLDTYGVISKQDWGKPAPRLVFAAAANLVDDDRTAPGLRAVSYVLSSDYIGGPDIGWVPTGQTVDLCPPHLQHDLTVQAAVAISGAAFASAMGRESAWYGTLLAISGARLGSWLPHPDYLVLRRDLAERDDWTLPGLPHVRRFPYLLREVLGIHPYFQRLLNVTDGGHYENLGLVEALRRRCRTIYVLDASGDQPPTATTFAEAIRLAHDELGVRITPRDPLNLVPGSGARLEPEKALSQLSDRLSKSGVILADVTYPAESGLPEPDRNGIIVFAKALLWPELPYEVLAYAAKDPLFPHDSTADQWFDEGKFSSYKRLGYCLGAVAANMPLDATQSTQTEHPEAPDPTSSSSPNDPSFWAHPIDYLCARHSARQAARAGRSASLTRQKARRFC